MILKICSWHGCTKVINVGEKYCEYHAKKADLENKERYKEYQHRRLKDKEQRKFQDLYNSGRWHRVRDAVIKDYHYIDILEFYRTGRIVEGEIVHHIRELEEDWDSRLDISNLIYLTEQNHRRVHVEYLKGAQEKKAMQRILLQLIEKFMKEYG